MTTKLSSSAAMTRRTWAVLGAKTAFGAGMLGTSSIMGRFGSVIGVSIDNLYVY